MDVAFGWTSFEHQDRERIEVVRLPDEQCVLRGTGVGMLTFCKNPQPAQSFMDFLVTEPARACYRKFGWETPPPGTVLPPSSGLIVTPTGT